MVRHPVSSSRITSVGWESNILEVQFTDGAVYQYLGVSHIEYSAFISAASLGSEISRLSKQHSYRRV